MQMFSKELPNQAKKVAKKGTTSTSKESLAKVTKIGKAK